MTTVVGDGVRKRTYAARGLPPRFVAHVEFERRADGKRNRRSKSFPTEADAKAWVRIQIAQAAASPSTAGQRPDRRTVGGLLEDWYAHGVHVAGWSPRHEAVMRHVIDTRLQAVAAFPVARFTVEDVDELVTQLVRAGVSPHTIRQARNALRAAFTFGQRRRQIPQGHNPAALARIPTTQRRDPGYVRAADLGAFLRAVEPDWRAPFFVTCAALALRPSEAVGLRWSDVDLDAGTVTVQRTVQVVPKVGPVVRPTKTHQERTLHLPADLAARLRTHRHSLRVAGRPHSGAAPVFPGPRGEPLNTRRANRVLGELLEKAGVPHVTLYQLRHTGATLRLRGGVSLETVRDELGHSSIAMTQRYAQVEDVRRKEAADVVSEMLKSAGRTQRKAAKRAPGGTPGGTPARVTAIRRRSA